MLPGRGIRDRVWESFAVRKMEKLIERWSSSHRGEMLNGSALNEFTFPLGGLRCYYLLPVDESEAADSWLYWMQARAETDYYPVITTHSSVTSRSTAERLLSRIENSADASTNANHLAVERVTRVVNRVTQSSLRAAEELDELDEAREGWIPENLATLLATEEASAAPNEPWDFLGQLRDRSLRLLLAPISSGDLAPLAFSDLLPWCTTAYPDFRRLHPSDHFAFLRKWHNEFGAEVLFMNGSEVHLIADRPPIDPIAISRLAIEQQAYCQDLYDVVEMGKRQVPFNSWSFWWD